MPELPEVETVARALRKALVDRCIINATSSGLALRKPMPTDLIQKLQGKNVVAVRRRAKYLLIDLSGSFTWLVHLGMSGSFRVLTTQTQKPHDHLCITTDQLTYLHYNDPRRFGLMDIFSTSAEDTHKCLKDLGPEPLAVDFTPEVLWQALQNTNRPIKNAILDQQIIAGIGNIYACESLWIAQISPFLPAKDLSLKQAEALHAALQQTLTASIIAGGSTLRDHRQPDGQDGAFQHQFRVYGKHLETCLAKNCGATIKQIKQGGRSTFYCPDCQRDNSPS